MNDPATVQPVPLASAQEMEALLAKALLRWRAGEITERTLAQGIMLAIQIEVSKAKQEVTALMVRAMRP